MQCPAAMQLHTRPGQMVLLWVDDKNEWHSSDIMRNKSQEEDVVVSLENKWFVLIFKRKKK